MQKVKIGKGFYSSDIYSNLGGFLIGLFLAMILINPARAPAIASQPKSLEKIVTYIGIGGVFVFFATMIPCFFFATHPTNFTND